MKIAVSSYSKACFSLRKTSFYTHTHTHTLQPHTWVWYWVCVLWLIFQTTRERDSKPVHFIPLKIHCSTFVKSLSPEVWGAHHGQICPGMNCFSCNKTLHRKNAGQNASCQVWLPVTQTGKAPKRRLQGGGEACSPSRHTALARHLWPWHGPVDLRVGSWMKGCHAQSVLSIIVYLLGMRTTLLWRLAA